MFSFILHLVPLSFPNLCLMKLHVQYGLTKKSDMPCQFFCLKNQVLLPVVLLAELSRARRSTTGKEMW